jgi:uncharacterized membrane-anchored protein
MAQKNDSKSKKDQLVKLAISICTLILILLLFTLYMAWPLMFGHKIVLDTRPVDPFDMFRGQYLTINYEISTIPTIEGAAPGQNVYVILKEDEKGISRYASATLSKPDDKNFIKGRVEYDNGLTMQVRYGIEQFFFEKDAVINTTKLTVEAKVGSDGRPGISRLLTDGKELDIEYQQGSMLIR